MAERPILFSAPMILPVADGYKVETRRIAKPRRGKSASLLDFDRSGEHEWADSYVTDPRNAEWLDRDVPCRPGDRLWTKESYRLDVAYDNRKAADVDSAAAVFWEAGGKLGDGVPGKLRPSIFQPRWASRCTLEVKEVRLERLHDIDDAGALREGVVFETADPPFYYVPGIMTHLTAVETWDGPRASYAKLWDHINGYGAWGKNPRVWVIVFGRV